MRFRLFPAILAILFFASPLIAQTQTPPVPSAEDIAFRGITELMSKTRQGGDNPTEADYKVRSEAGLEMSVKAKQFLKDYPASKNADDAQAICAIGLLEAAVTGNTTAADELQTRAAEAVKDPKMADNLKLQIFSVNHLAQWARKTGKRNLDPNSSDTQKEYTEAFFLAADVLPNKEEIFKMLLLQAKSNQKLSAEEKKTLAKRVLDYPAAPASIKAVAKEILSGESSYAIGKPLDLSFVAVDGKKINLADMKGKVVLIDFWATWCGPCVADMPNVKRAYDKYHAVGFEILGISLDESKDALTGYLKKNEIAWPQYFDGKQWNNDISFRFGISAVPTQWIIDKKGILRDTNVRGKLEDAVGALLQEK
jgi:thiol-disulfide isomerase/thioredoxin